MKDIPKETKMEIYKELKEVENSMKEIDNPQNKINNSMSIDM